MIRAPFGLLVALVGFAPALRAAEPLLIPNDTTAYLSLDVTKLRRNASAELVRLATDGATAEEWAKLTKSVGFDVLRRFA